MTRQRPRNDPRTGRQRGDSMRGNPAGAAIACQSPVKAGLTWPDLTPCSLQKRKISPESQLSGIHVSK
jgi:hypothetical protein